jgi:hypothetical protein
VGGIAAVNSYEVAADGLRDLFGWDIDRPTRGAFVGEAPGAVDLLEIPETLRGTVEPGVRLLAVVNRDAAAAGEAAAAAGAEVRGPFHAVSATGNPMTMVEVVTGGVPFELVQFG